MVVTVAQITVDTIVATGPSCHSQNFSGKILKLLRLINCTARNSGHRLDSADLSH